MILHNSFWRRRILPGRTPTYEKDDLCECLAVQMNSKLGYAYARHHERMLCSAPNQGCARNTCVSPAKRMAVEASTGNRAYRLALFIQLEVAHKHFRLARPTESAQGEEGSNRACYFGTSGGGFGEVSGAYRLVLFIQLEVAHKHFRLARPTESAQGGGSNRAC